MSPGINSFSSSAKFCDDLLPVALSSFFECGVSLSRHTCFALNGVGSFDDVMWKLKSEWWPPSLLSSLGCCFWRLFTIVSIVGSSIEILHKIKKTKQFFKNIVDKLVGLNYAKLCKIDLLGAFSCWLCVFLHWMFMCHQIGYMYIWFILIFL